MSQGHSSGGVVGTEGRCHHPKRSGNGVICPISHTFVVQGGWRARGFIPRITDLYGPISGKADGQAPPRHHYQPTPWDRFPFPGSGLVNVWGACFSRSCLRSARCYLPKCPQIDQRSLEEVLAEASTYAQCNATLLQVVLPSVGRRVSTSRVLHLVVTLSAQRNAANSVYGVSPPSGAPQRTAQKAICRWSSPRSTDPRILPRQ